MNKLITITSVMFLFTIIIIAGTTSMAVGKSHSNKRLDRMANNMFKSMVNGYNRALATGQKYLPNLTSPVQTPTLGNGIAADNSTSDAAKNMLDNMSKSANMTPIKLK